MASATAHAVTLPPPPSAAPRWFAWIGTLALLGYALFLAAHTTVVAGGSDSSGYLNSARLLASGRLQTELRVPAEFGPVTPENRAHFSPAGFNHFPGNPHLAPVYPTGFPLHLALAGRLLGWDAGPFLVQLLAAVIAVWLTYLVGRELGLPYPLAATGAAILAVFPVFIFTSIQTLSDTLATAWIMTAVYCGFRAVSAPRWAAACGGAFAIAVLVRPTNLLMAPALLLLVARDLRRFAWFVVAGLPGAAWLLFYNHRLYGGAFESGYGNIYADFGREYVAPSAVHFGRWLACFLPAALLVLPAVALWRRDTRQRGFFAVLLAALPGFIFYLFYGISHEAWWCLRFILPGIPGLILGGLLGVEAMARGVGSRWPAAFRGAVALMLLLWAAGNSA
jgi:4-amino-4-deoxy-L-arabinose transferase-like glycosyltransferase